MWSAGESTGKRRTSAPAPDREGGNSRAARRYYTGVRPPLPGAREAPASREPPTVTPSREMPLDRTARRFRRPLAVGLLLSVLLHVGLVLAAGRVGPGGALIPVPGAERARARPEPPPTDALRAVDVRPVKTRIRVPAPPRAVRAEPVEVEAAVPREEALGGSPLAPPPGGGEGKGPAGRTEAGSRLASPPVPRSVMPEWDAPASVRGGTVTVRVHVDSTGAPTGAVELDPPTPHDGFNRRLAETVRSMRFAPARTGAGRPVAAWAELTFSF